MLMDALSTAQRARTAAWAEEWIARGGPTGQVDWSRFEEAARRCYELAGLRWHGNVVRFDSPLALAKAAPAVGHYADVPGLTRHERFWTDVWQRAFGAASFGVWQSHDITAEVRRLVSEPVRRQARDEVGRPVHERTCLADVVYHQLVDLERRSRVKWAHPASRTWVADAASLSFFRDVGGLELPAGMWERLEALAAACTSACMWWSTRRVVGVCDPPVAIHRDDAGRLHHAEDRAIEWPDGWGIYSWHGTTVDRWVLARPLERISAGTLAIEPRVEFRRVLSERLGRERLLWIMGAAELHSDDYGVLWDARRLPGMTVDRCRWVEVIDASPEPIGSDLPPLDAAWAQRLRAMTGAGPLPGRRYRRYLIPVSTEPRTARAAVAWSNRMPEDEWDFRRMRGIS